MKPGVQLHLKNNSGYLQLIIHVHVQCMDNTDIIIISMNCDVYTIIIPESAGIQSVYSI